MAVQLVAGAGARQAARRSATQTLDTLVGGTIDLDLASIRTGAELYALLATMLGFPTCYGCNWDAFWDCITDHSQSSLPDVLRVRGWAGLAQCLPRDAKLMRECLVNLASKRPDCKVRVPDLAQEPSSAAAPLAAQRHRRQKHVGSQP